MSDAYVLDSFALLAYFLDEPGATRYEELLEQVVAGAATFALSVVNMGEVMYTIATRRSMAAAALGMAKITQWPIEIVEIDTELGLEAARVKATTRMGYLDSFVVALAQRRNAIVVTGDPDFRRAVDLVAIDWLPGRHAT
jgi:predicted nucleic acid-binding protein